MGNEIRLEKFFLVCALFFGLIYVFLLPPFQSVDEASHFYRGYEVLSGHFVAKKQNNAVGDYLPASLSELSSKYSFLMKNIDKKIGVDYIFKTADIKLNPDNIKFTEFGNTALYSPICYITQIPGMFIAKVMQANPLIIFYIGRLSNLFFFVLIGYLTLRIMPFYKLPTLLLLLMPMALSLGGALTSDVVVLGFNFLWIAILLKLLTQERMIKYFEIFILYIISLMIAVSKSYFLLIPLVFLLPISKFRSRKNYFACMFGVVTISLVAALLWQKSIAPLGFSMNPDSDAISQFQFIISHPLSYFITFVKTLFVKLPRIVITMVGVLGWQDTRLDFLTYMIYPAMFVGALFVEKRTDFNFERWQLTVILADILLSVFVIFTTMYLMWSPVGANIITGLNGKYFISLVLPALLLFWNKKTGLSKYEDVIKILIFVAVILILLSSDLSLLHRFYDITPNLYYKV